MCMHFTTSTCFLRSIIPTLELLKSMHSIAIFLRRARTECSSLRWWMVSCLKRAATSSTSIEHSTVTVRDVHTILTDQRNWDVIKGFWGEWFFNVCFVSNHCCLMMLMSFALIEVCDRFLVEQGRAEVRYLWCFGSLGSLSCKSSLWLLPHVFSVNPAAFLVCSFYGVPSMGLLLTFAVNSVSFFQWLSITVLLADGNWASVCQHGKENMQHMIPYAPGSWVWWVWPRLWMPWNKQPELQDGKCHVLRLT